MTPTISLLLCADRSYQSPLMVTIASSLRSLAPGYQLQVTIVTPEEKAIDPRAVESHFAGAPGMKAMQFVSIPPRRLEGLAGNKHLSPATYLRLIALDQVPLGDRVLYLDSDVLVRHSLHRLWETPLEQMVAAVRDGAEAISLRRDHWSRIQPNRPPLPRYFNAGVLLIDVKRWRRRDTSSRVLIFARRHPLELCDQDALNVLLREDVQWLDERWNWQFHAGQDWMRFVGAPLVKFLIHRRSASIVHFVNGTKPWSTQANGPFVPQYHRQLRALGLDSVPLSPAPRAFAEGTPLWALRHCWITRNRFGVLLWLLPALGTALLWWKKLRPLGSGRSWLADPQVSPTTL